MVDPKAELAINNNKSGSRYDTWGPPRNSSAGAKKAHESYESYRNIDNWGYDDGVLVFRPLYREDEESGVHSPPLWRTATSPPARHQYYNNKNITSHQPTLSQPMTSRAQAIARGQRELMEMVKNMPESCYELSLKDLVEVDQHPAAASHMMRKSTDQEQEQDEECLLGLGEKNYDHDVHDQQQVALVVVAADDDDDQSRWVNITRIETKKKSNNTISIMKRSTSMDHHNRGLFLKMVLFPIYNLMSSNNIKKKHVIKSSCTTSTSCTAKVSPKPAAQVLPAGRTSSNFVDKEYWWKKKSSTNSKSTHYSTSSGRSSSSSSSSRDHNMMSKSPNSSVRKKSGLCFSSCLPCFRFNGKLAE